MQNIVGYMRRVAWMLIEGTAEDYLRGYLRKHIRREFLDGVNFRGMMAPVYSKANSALGGGIPSEEFFGDLVDSFVGEPGESDWHIKKLVATLEHWLHRDKDLSEKAAEELVDPSIPLKLVEGIDRDKLEKIVAESHPVIARFLGSFFNNKSMDWVKYWKSRGRGDVKQMSELEPSEKPDWIKYMEDHEVEQLDFGDEGLDVDEIEDVEDKIEENDLYERVLGYIGREKDSLKKRIYEAILLKRWKSDSPKTQAELAKELGVTQPIVSQAESGLAGELRDYLKDKFRSMRAPDYKKVLEDDKDDQESFKDFIKHKYEGMKVKKPSTLKVVMELAEGKDSKEIAKELEISDVSIRKMKERYFKPWYEEWYSGIKCAGSLMTTIYGAEVRVPYKKVTDPKAPDKDKAPDDEKKGKLNNFRTIIDSVIEKPLDFTVTITFSSDYSAQDVYDGTHSLEDDSHFKYESYRVDLSKIRKFGKTEYEVEYWYEAALNDDGTFKGAGRSQLKLNDDIVRAGDPGSDLKNQLDEYVDKNMVDKGVYPKTVPYSIRYYNTKTKQYVYGLEDFASRYPSPIGHGGPKAREYFEKFVERQRKKRIGPVMKDVTDKVTALILTLQDDLRREKSLRTKDTGLIKHIEDQIKDLRDALQAQKKRRDEEAQERLERQLEIKRKERLKYLREELDEEQKVENKDDAAVKRINDLEKQIKELEEKMDRQGYWKSIYSGDREYDSLHWYLRRAADVVAQQLPDPMDAGAKEFVALLNKLGLTSRPNPKLWMTSEDIRVLSRTVLKLLQDRLKKDLEKASKESASTKEEKARRADKVQAIQKEYDETIKKLPKLIDAFIDDLKDRRDKLQSQNPKEYEALSGRRDLGWVDDKGKVEKLKDDVRINLSKEPPKVLTKDPSVKPMRHDRYEFILNDAMGMKNSLAGIADRFQEASVEPLGSKKVRDEIKDSLDKMRSDVREMSKEINSIVEKREKREEGLKADPEFKALSNQAEDALSTFTALQDLKNVDVADLPVKLKKFMGKIDPLIKNMEQEISEVELTQQDKDKIKRLEDEIAEIDKKLQNAGPEEKKELENRKKRLRKVIDNIEESGSDRKKIKLLKPLLDSLKKKRDILNEIFTPGALFSDRHFKDAPIGESKGRDRQILQSLIRTFEDKHKELLSGIENLRKSPMDKEEETHLRSLYDSIKELRDPISKAKEDLGKLSFVPALKHAEILQSLFKYFSGLYNFISSAIWFKEMSAPDYKKADEVVAGVITADVDLERMRDEIASQMRRIQGYGIKAKDSIKESVKKVRDMLKKFIDSFEDVYKNVERKAPEYQAPGRKGPREMKPFERTKLEPYKRKFADREEDIAKFVIPGDMLKRAEKLIDDLPREFAVKAREELKGIKGALTQAFKEGLSQDYLEKMSKKFKMNINKTRSTIKDMEDGLVRELMNEFINNWMDIKDTIGVDLEKQKKKDEKHTFSPLGNKDPKVYKRMRDFVRDHVKGDLNESAAIEPKDIKPAQLTPDEILDFIEEAYERGPARIKEYVKNLYRNYSEWDDEGGGGGGKGRTREKPKKLNPPAITSEINKLELIRLLKNGDALDVILEPMGDLITKIEREYKGSMNVDDITDGLVKLLKDISSTIISLNVRKAGQGPADISIKSYEDGIEFFNTIVDVYKAMNKYLDPDHVGIPPKNLSKISPKNPYTHAIEQMLPKFLPKGLTTALEELGKAEGKFEHIDRERAEEESKKMQEESKQPGLQTFHDMPNWQKLRSRKAALDVVGAFVESREYDPETIDDSMMLQ